MIDPITFYDGNIFHQRLGNKKHEFTNRHLFLLLNLTKIKKKCIFKHKNYQYPFFSINKFNLLSWHIEDHGSRTVTSIEKLEYFLINLLKIKRFDQIYLLCLPKILSFGFNPISIYFICDNKKITHTVYEVKNTFGDIHHYLSDKTSFKSKFKKKMFVSPFYKNKGYYKISSKLDKSSVSVHIQYIIKNKLKLKASLNAKIIEKKNISILYSLIKSFSFPGKVWLNIHYEALKLFLKKIKVEKKPLEKTTKHSFLEKS